VPIVWTAGLVLALAVAAFHVRARIVDARRMGDLSKAVPIALLAALVAVEPAPIDAGYRWLVVAALLFSLAGDVCLVFARGFVPGLASFLVAHLLYVAAFARQVDGTPARGFSCSPSRSAAWACFAISGRGSGAIACQSPSTSA